MVYLGFLISLIIAQVFGGGKVTQTDFCCKSRTVLDGWEERLSFLWPEGDGWGIIAALDG